MQNTDDNIDLDALFDMLNIVQGQTDASSVTTNKAPAQSDQGLHEVQDLSPLGADFFIIDLPADQS
jgi:hypothetical protein